MEKKSPLSTPRLLTLTSDSGELDIIPIEFHAKEKISTLPDYKVLITRRDRPLNLKALHQQTLCLTLTAPHCKPQYYHGDVVRITPEFRKGWPMLAWLHLQPRLHRLQYHHGSRPFVSQTPQEITVALFDQQQWANTQFAKQRYSYSRINYYVQHEETHFQCIDRLLREKGFFFYFSSIKKGSTLVIADNSLTMPKLKEPVIYTPHTVDEPHALY